MRAQGPDPFEDQASLLILLVIAMCRPRFSISTLLLMVLTDGVAFAALKSPSELWASALFTLAVSVLLVAVLLAVHRRDRARAYWLGFALFGWVYLILSLVPEAAPRLATTGAAGRGIRSHA